MALESNATATTERFELLLEALEPWLDRAVIVGGWTLPLLRHHPRALGLSYAPLFTEDADVAVPLELRAESANLRERLLARDFHEEFIGEDKPPATHYQLGADGGFYAEFLTPLVGSESSATRREMRLPRSLASPRRNCAISKSCSSSLGGSSFLAFAVSQGSSL